MLDTIRQLTRQIKLKEIIINNFVPPEEAKKVGKRQHVPTCGACSGDLNEPKWLCEQYHARIHARRHL
jgi:hypothetical protein